LIRLLGYVENPRSLAGEMKKSERDWLVAIEDEIDFHDAGLAELFPAAALDRALQVFVLLTR
jgi:hypothetical protein